TWTDNQRRSWQQRSPQGQDQAWVNCKTIELDFRFHIADFQAVHELRRLPSVENQQSKIDNFNPQSPCCLTASAGICCEARFPLTHGQSFRITPLHCSGRPYPSREEYAGTHSGGASECAASDGARG